jgi:hypothetical protein
MTSPAIDSSFLESGLTFTAALRSEVAVVVPIYRKLAPTESLALALARTVLGSYPLFAVMPDGLELSAPGFELIRLPGAWFASIKGYASLMCSTLFYRLFREYRYVLIYQLDCLCFSPDLKSFVNCGYDYIAPLILGRADGCWPDEDIVGVGGLSLRKVSSFSRVLDRLEQPEYNAESAALRGRIERNGAEDMFWSLSAPQIDPSYRVAPADVALAFGFEGDPSRSFRRAGGCKPFACHHWNRLPYFLWYLPWIRLPLAEQLRLLPGVFFELLAKEVYDLWLRVVRVLSRQFAPSRPPI